MDIVTARMSVGLKVTSFDPHGKLVKRSKKRHGPYILIKVTKKGFAILSGRENDRVCVSALSSFDGCLHSDLGRVLHDLEEGGLRYQVFIDRESEIASIKGAYIKEVRSGFMVWEFYPGGMVGRFSTRGDPND